MGWAAWVGLASASTLLALPLPPANVKVLAGNTTAGLTWDAPLDPGNVALEAIYRDNTLAGTVPPSQQGFVATGLINGQSYVFEVRAVDSLGNSMASAAVTAVPAVFPPAPAEVAAQATGSWQAQVDWAASSPQTFPVAGYEVYRALTPAAAGAALDFVSAATHYLDSTANSLTGLGHYYYRVAAVDTRGNTGPPSTWADLPTYPVTAPAGPVNLSAQIMDSAVALQWNAGSGLPPEGYRILYTTTPGSGEQEAWASGAATSLTITGLANQQVYYFYVAAVQAGVLSPRSEISAVPLAIPGAVSGLQAYGGTGYVRLNWQAVAGGGVTGYKVYAGDVYPSVTVTTLPADTLEYTYLTGSSAYFSVVAVNSLGEGIAAETGLISPGSMLPAFPAGLRAELGLSQSVWVHWTPNPAADNVQTYHLFWAHNASLGPFQSVDIPASAGANSVAAAGLINGVSYDFFMTAESGTGVSAASLTLTAMPLAAPVNFSTHTQGTNLVLTWEASAQPSGATYQLYQIHSGAEDTLLLSTPTRFSFSLNTLANETFQCRLTAINGQGVEIDPAYRLTATLTPGSPPAPPDRVALTPGNRQVAIFWKSVANTKQYRIFRSQQSGASGVLLAQNVSSVLTYWLDQDNLTNKQKYYYTLSAVNDAGESTRSAEAETIPFLPPQLPANSALGISQFRRTITLSWAAATPGDYGIAGYNLYRSSDGGTTYVRLGAQPTVEALGATISGYLYVDQGVEYGQTYFYRLHALDAQTPGQESEAYPLVLVTVLRPINQFNVFRNAFDPARMETAPVQLMLVQPGRVWIKIYNLAGEHVRTLLDTDVQGAYSADYPFISSGLFWDGRNGQGDLVASGVYILHAEGPARYHQTRKVAVIK